MIIEMFNGWYFFWLILCAGVTAGLYFLLRNKSAKTQKIVLFSLLPLSFIIASIADRKNLVADIKKLFKKKQSAAK